MRPSRVATRKQRRGTESRDNVVGIIEQLDAEGRVCHRWQARQRQVSIGSHQDCSIHIEDSELAPVHAILIFGKRNVFVRSIVGVIRADDRLVREWLFDHPATLRIGEITLRVLPYPDAIKSITEQQKKEKESQRESLLPNPTMGSDSQAIEAEVSPSAELKQMVEELLHPIRETLQDVRAQLSNHPTPLQPRPEFEHDSAAKWIDEIDARIRDLLDQKDEHLSAVLQSFQETISDHKLQASSSQITSQFGIVLDGIQQKLGGVQSDFQTFRAEVAASLNEMGRVFQFGENDLSAQIRALAERSERLEAILVHMREDLLARSVDHPTLRPVTSHEEITVREDISTRHENYGSPSNFAENAPDYFQDRSGPDHPQEQESDTFERQEYDVEYQSNRQSDTSFIPFDPTVSLRNSPFARGLTNERQSAANLDGDAFEEAPDWHQESPIPTHSEEDLSYLNEEATFKAPEDIAAALYGKVSSQEVPSNEISADGESHENSKYWKSEEQHDEGAEQSELDSYPYGASQGTIAEQEPPNPSQEFNRPSGHETDTAPTHRASAPSEEDSIEDYMAQLLRRLRGEGATTPEKDPPQIENRITNVAPLTNSLRQSMGDLGTGTETVPNPGESVKDPIRRRPTTKEQPNDIAAMREIANSSTRTALHLSKAKRMTSTIQSKIALASIGYSAAIFLAIQNGIGFNYATVGTLSSLAVGVIWTGEAIVTFRKLRREEKANQAAAQAH